MKKYEIWTENFERKLGKKDVTLSASDIFDLYLNSTVLEPKRVERFDTIEEARACWEKHYKDFGSTRVVQAWAGGWLLLGDIAYLEENEYDENDEFDQGGDILEYSAEPYSFSYEEEDDG